MAVCPVSFDEAYGEPGGPRLRATPFRSMGRDSRLGEPRDGYGPRASSNRLGTRGRAVRPREEDVASPTSRGWGARLEPRACARALGVGRGDEFSLSGLGGVPLGFGSSFVGWVYVPNTYTITLPHSRVKGKWSLFGGKL